jgi:predicted DNA-binding transcriptional regulator YafY
MISPTFFGWLFGFGEDMRVISPESLKTELKAKLSEIMKSYEQ